MKIDATLPEPEIIARAAEILHGGGLVAFPTETVYGLGANALEGESVARIYEAKGRPSRNPLIVHVSEAAEVHALVSEWPEHAALLAQKFWPGPLTLVLPRTARVPDAVTGGGETVGVRVPAHPVAHALLKTTGFPIAAPSANLSLQLSPTRAEHVLAGLTGRIEAILDGGPTSGGLESTVLDLTRPVPLLLRPGLITPAQIEAVIGPIERLSTNSHAVSAQGPLPAPGMLSRHYAPHATLEIYPGDPLARIVSLLAKGERVGWLTRRSREEWSAFADANAEADPHLSIAPMPDDPALYASDLYATLHTLDGQSVTRILVDPLPESDDWLAVRDRLQRASAPDL